MVIVEELLTRFSHWSLKRVLYIQLCFCVGGSPTAEEAQSGGVAEVLLPVNQTVAPDSRLGKHSLYSMLKRVASVFVFKFRKGSGRGHWRS